MNTELIYLKDTYLFNGESKLLSIEKDENGAYAIFDKTVFYPQGGGQESDIGKITIELSDSSKFIKEINFVRFKDGIVQHYGDFNDVLDLKQGNVLMEVNGDVRIRNSKLHTAGHLIASIVENMNIGLRAVKGYHFNDGSYVGFEVIDDIVFENLNVEESINNQIEKAIKQNLKVSSEILTLEELKQVCSYVPPYLPVDKPLRVVTIESYPPIPCGGTHVGALSELLGVKIRKISKKKAEIKISYSLS